MQNSMSLLKKHVYKCLKLPLPQTLYDVTKIRLAHGKQFPFETASQARIEDLHRAKVLKKGTDLVSRIGRILDNLTVHDVMPLSFASSAYYRVLRLRLVGQIARLILEELCDLRIVSFTIVPPKLRIPIGELETFAGDKAMNMLRRLLRRHGLDSMDGFLFAGLHGESDGEYYQLHFHGVAVGETVAVLDRLRASPSLKPYPDVILPLKIRTMEGTTDIKSLLIWLTYCLQCFWPFRPRFVGADGQIKRSRKKTRLPETQELEFLTWMSKRNLGELTLFYGSKWERVDGKVRLKASAV